MVLANNSHLKPEPYRVASSSGTNRPSGFIRFVPAALVDRKPNLQHQSFSAARWDDIVLIVIPVTVEERVAAGM